MDGTIDSNLHSSEPSEMQTETADIAMEDGEIYANDDATSEPEEVGFKRERHVSDSMRNSFTALDEEKLKKRAERFGIEMNTPQVATVTKEEMKELYESLDLPEDEIKSVLETGATNHTLNHRFEAIHLRGTEEMSTQDVFRYFQGYAPGSIEWINDYSCNVVWLEPWQAAKAMLERSTQRVINTIPTRETGLEGEAMEHEESTGSPNKSVPIPLPPGVWRQGVEFPLAKALVMRFATRADRKVKGAERMSNYYRHHGNPHFGGMKGLISSSRKRRFRGKDDPPEQVDSKNPWGTLAESWGAGDPEEILDRGLQDSGEKRPTGTGLPTALVRRLGHQPPRPSPSRSRDTESEGSDYYDSDESDSGGSSHSSTTRDSGGRSRKKRIRMRMYADEEEERGKRKKIQMRLKEADAELNGRTIAKAVRPVRARLGPSPDLRTSPSAAVASGDLRQRLGSSASRSPVVPASDSEGDDDDDSRHHLASDLRSKLQSRLGAK